MANFFDGVIEEASVKPPIAVLKELAQELANKTQGLLIGKVEQNFYSNPVFDLEFYIAAPSLNNYEYKVFEIKHDFNFYPLEVIPPSKEPNKKAKNQDELEEILKSIISSPQVKRVINGLLAQIKST